MSHKLHKFVPPFTLYLNAENAQNPARKHFEKTTITFAKYCVFDSQQVVTLKVDFMIQLND